MKNPTRLYFVPPRLKKKIDNRLSKNSSNTDIDPQITQRYLEELEEDLKIYISNELGEKDFTLSKSFQKSKTTTTTLRRAFYKIDSEDDNNWGASRDLIRLFCFYSTGQPLDKALKMLRLNEDDILKPINRDINTLQLPEKIVKQFEEFSLDFFEQVKIPEHTSTDANNFYNGYPPQWTDIKAGFDFQRECYTKKDGIKNKLQELITENSNGTKYITISGVAGTGKSTLLRRICYDLVQQDELVYFLIADKITNDNILSELRRIITIIEKRIIIVIEDVIDVVNLNPHDQNILAKYFEEINRLQLNKLVIFILSDQTNRISKLPKGNLAFTKNHNFFPFTIEKLKEKECADLIDKIIEYEQKGILEIKIKNGMTREMRLELCKNKADWHFVVAMLQMRYGEIFKQIIIREFERTPYDEGKEAYKLICLFSQMNTSIPFDLLMRAIPQNAIHNKVVSSLEGLVIDTNQGYRARHPKIAQIIFSYSYKNGELMYSQLLKSDLMKVISEINVYYIEEFNVFHSCFIENKFSKIKAQLFNSNIRRIQDFFAPIELYFQYSKQKLAYVLSCRGVLEVAVKSERATQAAIQTFKRIINLGTTDSESFAYRQLSWLYKDINPEKKSFYIIKALDASDSWRNILECANMLSKGDIKEAERADLYFQKALNLSGNSPIVIHSYSRYRSRLKHRKEELNIRDNAFNLLIKWRINPSNVNLSDLDELFKKDITINKDHPFSISNYGTYLKEVKKDMENALLHYRLSIEKANRTNYKNHPRLLNNLALLLMELFEIDTTINNKHMLIEAQSLLSIALTSPWRDKYKKWILVNLEKCNTLLNRL